MPRLLSQYCLRHIVFLLLLMSAAAHGQDRAAYSSAWRGVAFETPVAFSAPIDAGLDAVALVNPPDQTLGKGRMELTLIAFSKEMQESLGGSDADCYSYALAVFFGSTAAAKDAGMRAFLDKAIVGRTFSKSIPSAQTVEIYLVPLSDGSKIAIAVSRFQGVSEKEAEDVMLALSRTFRETTAR
ncbi:MAG: hypothetical protein IPP94_01950 [Ignavibacteria bacterium]|nr:hypothetical protein [Ignavibacteria bacterium]